MTTQTDPFASVRIRSPESSRDMNISNQFIQKEDPFSEVRIKESESFPGVKEIGRHAARIGSRVAETIGGIPGDVTNLLQSGIFYGLEKLTGKKFTKEQKVKVKEFRKFPTSQELQEKSEKLTGGFTKAQGPTEETIDEFAQTAASLLGPIKFRKALGIALGSQLAKEGLKISGVGEGVQEAGKLGTMFLLTAMNPGGAMKYASNQFKVADNLARGSSITAIPFESYLINLINDLKKGVTTPSKNAVIKPAEELIGKIKNGKILVRDLTAAKRDINTLMGDPALLKRDKKLLKVLGKEVDKAIKPYEKINPAFSKAYRPANEIFGAVMEGNKASNFISKILGTKSVLGAVIAETALGHPEAILPTAAFTAAGIGTAKAVDFFSRLAKSPELRKYYNKALLAGAKEDAPALRLYNEKIEEIMQKD